MKESMKQISPNDFEILTPLKEWRILSTADLKRISGHEKSKSAFYKVVTKLAKNQLADSFINPWTNEKYLFLLPLAHKMLGTEKENLPVNLDQRFHDAIVTKVALNLKDVSKFEEVYLDQNIPKSFPLLEKTPDIVVSGNTPQAFRLAFEIELTQKSKHRLDDIFKSYSNSKVVNNVIYITDKKTIFKSYIDFLNEYDSLFNKSKFIFIYEKDLRLKAFNLMSSPAYFNGKGTSLKELLRI